MMMGAAGLSEALQYVEDVFSTYLYTGNGGGLQTITNGIDLAGKGGLVWGKSRAAASSHFLLDTARGGSSILRSDQSVAAITQAGTITFGANGFDLDNNGLVGSVNAANVTWTFRKAPKFFDVVTFTANGSLNTVLHTLGSVPACIFVKRLDSAGSWVVYHRGLPNPNNQLLSLNSGNAASNATAYWGTGPTSTQFQVDLTNAAGTYVAYLFAHDPSADGLIQCGGISNAGFGSNPLNSVTLGWEPQFVLLKATNQGGSDWVILDSMRGWENLENAPSGSRDAVLFANTAFSESRANEYGHPTATGFEFAGFNANATSGDYIYIAIRRPNKPPTLGSQVFNPQLRTGDASENNINVGFPVDFFFTRARNGDRWVSGNRLAGLGRHLAFNLTDSELNYGTPIQSASINNGVLYGDIGGANPPLDASGVAYIDCWFRRAPKFFDVVAYTGTGVARTVNHNLGAVPELMIVKARNAAANWYVYAQPLGNTGVLFLNTTNANLGPFAGPWNATSPTSSVFTVGTEASVNQSGLTFAAYLFASLAGVSKVGSYTGNGASQTINCGFTTGARFILIKRTDAAGDWYVWDTARGIVTGNDPRLSLNTNAAELSDDSVDPDPTGFIVNQLAATNINVNGGQYIFLSIA